MVVSKIGVIFILGGALSNLIDRYRYGCVIDFIDIKIWPIFNLADIFITIGAIIVILRNFKK
jgi:signal peptidase II